MVSVLGEKTEECDEEKECVANLDQVVRDGLVEVMIYELISK